MTITKILRLMPFKLTSTDGAHSFDLKEGVTLVVGRAPTSDVPVIDPTISRRHAEVEYRDGTIVVRDLGSSNGTFVNGSRVDETSVNAGDTITFGKVGFKVQRTSTAPPARHSGPTAAASATIVRQLPVREQGSLSGMQSPLYVAAAPSELNVVAMALEKSRQRLATLLEVSKGLGKETDIDSLLDKIAGYAYQILEVERVAIHL